MVEQARLSLIQGFACQAEAVVRVRQNHLFLSILEKGAEPISVPTSIPGKRRYGKALINCSASNCKFASQTGARADSKSGEYTVENAARSDAVEAVRDNCQRWKARVGAGFREGSMPLEEVPDAVKKAPVI